MKKLLYAITILSCISLKPMDNMDIDFDQNANNYTVESDGFSVENRQKRKEPEAYQNQSDNGEYENNPDAMNIDYDDYTSDQDETVFKKEKLTEDMDCDEFNYHWHYQLLQAIQKDDLAMIGKIYLKFGNEINRFSLVGNQYPLTWAITKGNSLIANKLLRYGADINWQPNPSECMNYNENDIPLIALVKKLRDNAFFLDTLEYCLKNNAQIDSLFYEDQSIRSHLRNLKNDKITELLEYYS